MPSKHRQSNAPKLLRGVLNCREDLLRFPSALVAAGNTENAHSGNVPRKPWREHFRKREIGADRDECSFGWTPVKPGKLFGRNGEDGKVREIERLAHGVLLNSMAEVVDEPRAGERFDVVKDNGDACAKGFQDTQSAGKFHREAASGPREGRILREHPGAAPRLGLETKRPERLTPPMKFPRDAANLHLEIVRLEGGAEVEAIFFDSVGGFVFAAEKGDELAGH